MTAGEPKTVLIGVFSDPGRAARFVEELRQAGFPDQEVGVATPGPAEGAEADEGAKTGAVAGGALGIVAGVALATGLIPGIGPVLAGGLLAGLVGGTVGATAGGVLGALIGMGVSEEQARHYEGELRAGRTLVVVKAPGRYGEALGILRRCEAA